MSSQPDKKKTWGREIAFIILLWFFWIVETKDIEYVKILTLPVFTFVFSAYGLKRLTDDTGLFQRPTFTTNRGRPQHSGEYSGGQGEYTDYRGEYSTEVRPQPDYLERERKTTRPPASSRTSPESDK